MERALVVIDDEESGEELLSEVDSIARTTGTDVVAVSMVTEEEYEHDQSLLQQIGDVEQRNYDRPPAEFAEDVAEQFVADALSDAVDCEIVGALVAEDDQANFVLETAAEKDCDYIYIRGKRRSPTGKAIFGDRAQEVLLNFDGYVTVTMS